MYVPTESCHIYEWVIICISPVSQYVYYVYLITYISHVCSHWVMSHIWMSHNMCITSEWESIFLFFIFHTICMTHGIYIIHTSPVSHGTHSHSLWDTTHALRDWTDFFFLLLWHVPPIIWHDFFAVQIPRLTCHTRTP